jgi:hypothetical protein
MPWHIPDDSIAIISEVNIVSGQKTGFNEQTLIILS